MTTFYTADQHLGHTNILTYCNRPWSSADEMNEGLLERWNAVVKPEDTVWVLGDWCMGKFAETIELTVLFNGTKHLVTGNHDRCWAGNAKTKAASRGIENATQRYLDAGFASVHQHVVFLEDGTLLCHFPYQDVDRHENKFADYQPYDRGAWLYHGHVHDTWKTRGRMVNVGCDVWNFAPVDEGTLLALRGIPGLKQHGSSVQAVP
jgi:calcineurin-like phosphoesterase family protein